MKFLMTLSLIVLQVSLAQAATLLTLSNDRNTGTATLGIQTDARNEIQKISYAAEGGQKLFSLAQLKAGAVLEEQQGVQALVLTGDIASGKLTIRYVYNGLSGEYRSCDMNIGRRADGQWGLTNAYTGAALRNAKLITWSLGIETLQGLCPAQ